MSEKVNLSAYNTSTDAQIYICSCGIITMNTIERIDTLIGNKQNNKLCGWFQTAK